jgi:hypothetical protein
MEQRPETVASVASEQRGEVAHFADSATRYALLQQEFSG